MTWGFFACDTANTSAIWHYISAKIDPPLKTYIIQTLKTKNMKEAGDYWRKHFVIPASQLLVDHLDDMKSSPESLQVLLELYERYHRCLFYCKEPMDLRHEDPESVLSPNFMEIYHKFYENLVDTLLSDDISKESENILCALLMDEERTKIGGKACDYRVSLLHLIKQLNKSLVTIGEQQVNTSIARAIAMAQERCKKIEEEEHAWSMGRSMRNGAGV